MKNIYLFGASDDCHEVETDFGQSHESYGDIWVNEVLFRFVFDGDWGVYPVNPESIPETWKVFPVQGNMAMDLRRQILAGNVIHIQVTDDEPITFDDDGEEEQ